MQFQDYEKGKSGSRSNRVTLNSTLQVSLVRAIKDVALDQGWTQRQTYEHALLLFIKDCEAGLTSGTYHGLPPGGMVRSLFVSREIRDAVHAIHQWHGAQIGQIVQEALVVFCDRMGRPAPVEYPAKPSNMVPVQRGNR